MALLQDNGVRMDWHDASRADRAAAEAVLPPPLAHIAMDGRPTILIAGQPDRTATLRRWADRAGLRPLGCVLPAALADRLAQTVQTDLILIDLRGLPPEALPARAVATPPGGQAPRLAIITDLAGLDRTLARMDGPDVEFLCEPADSDVITLLVMAGLAPAQDRHARLRESGLGSEAARLERLSEEVRRLAVTIERLAGQGAIGEAPAGVMAPRGAYRAASGGETAQPPSVQRQPAAPDDRPQPVDHADVRAVIRARRMRDQFLPAELFADPAWDMMLDLLAARLTGQRVSVSSLCIASAVPPTTALRWIRQLTDRNVFARIDDPADGRRVFIELTDDAASALTAWIQAVRRNGGLLCAPRR